MVVEAYCDREIPDVVQKLLAYQRDAPIHIRIVSMNIGDFELPDGRFFSDKLKLLIAYKGASITFVVNPDTIKTEEDKEMLRKFEEIGVRVHYKRELHAKVILLGSKRDKAALVTSANFTKTGLWKQKEIAIYCLNELEQVYTKLYDYVTDLLKVRPTWRGFE